MLAYWLHFEYPYVKKICLMRAEALKVDSMIVDEMPNRLRRNQSPSSFGARLRRFRTERALTQQELGKRVGLSKRMMAYYEIQHGTPSAPLASKFAAALDISLEQLLGKDARPSSPTPTPDPGAELRLWRKFRRVQQLSDRDRRAVFQLIDSLLARSQDIPD
jgi:transcriptional regulator with XRE-family HTH domain